MADIAQRFPENPILTPADLTPSREGLKIECLLNPGVFRFEGKTWLLPRVAERPEQPDDRTIVPVFGGEDRVELLEFANDDPRLNRTDPRVIVFDGEHYLTTLSHLRPVAGDDGVHFREAPGFPPLTGRGPLETYGIEDCRVTELEGRFLLTYTAVSPNGVGVGLRATRDWRSFEHHGMIFPPHNKDCAVFSEKIAGRYFALHRPSSPEIGGNFIWIAQSPDLRHWGGHHCVARSRPGMWDSARVGAGAAPIRTPEGWLEIYHGADANHRYCLGALLLDLEEPWRVLARSDEPIMEPLAPYEREGFFGHVVFTNGHTADGDTLTIYYGASDSVICGARFSIAEILETLRRA